MRRGLCLALGVLAGCLATFGPRQAGALREIPGPGELSPAVVEYAPGLRGLLYLPEGEGPFPAILYNHGSAPGRMNERAFAAIAPVFLSRGWAFFAPYRRGQGLSAGPYVLDEVALARRSGGAGAAAARLAELLAGPQLEDQRAAFHWLAARPEVDARRIAAMGNSFGGIETVLGAADLGYCAAVDAAGASESWAEAPELRALLLEAAGRAAAPMLFVQAANDHDLAPGEALDAVRWARGLPSELRAYPAFGRSASEGHALAWRGTGIWAADVTAFVAANCPG